MAIASRLGGPVAAKIVTRRGAHKTDVNGVRLGLSSADDIRRAYDELTACARRLGSDVAEDGILIQPMVTGGVETIVGVVHDPLFGPLIGFGIGGVDVELFGDMRFRVAPLTDRDVAELIEEPRGARLLHGHRGRPLADIEALRNLVTRVSRLAEAIPEVMELDLNPVVVLPAGQGCRIVDARIRVGVVGV